MKGNYRHSSTRTHVLRIVGVGLAVVVVIILGRSFLIGGVSTANDSVYRSSSWLMAFKEVMPQYFKEKVELQQQISELESQLAGRRSAERTIDRFVAENIRLRSLLNASSSPRVLANIIGRPPQLPYDALLIDIGAEQGIQENAVVYYGRDQAVGVVVAVYPQSALVALITSPGVESSVFVIGPDIYTTAVGIGGGVLQVNVPQGVSLNQNDLVMVPALGEGVYGQIAEVVSVPTEPVQYGFVTTDIPIQQLRNVTVSQAPQSSISFEEAAARVEAAQLELLRVDVPADVLVDVASGTPTTTPTSTPQ
mgnify:CR=1 FL=1